MQMKHKDSPGAVADVTDEAFETLWEPRGWERVTAEQAVALELTAGLAQPTADLESLGKQDLQNLASLRGVDVPSSATKAEIITALQAAATETAIS